MRQEPEGGRGRGEDGWGIYIQSVACRVLHAVEFSATCRESNSSRISSPTLLREQEERKAVGEAAKKKEKNKRRRPTRLVRRRERGGGVRGGGGRRGGRGGGETLHVVQYYQFKGTISNGHVVRT